MGFFSSVAFLLLLLFAKIVTFMGLDGQDAFS